MAGANTLIRMIATVYICLLMITTWIVAFVLQLITLVITYPFIKSSVTRQRILGQIFRGVSSLVIHCNPLWGIKVLSKIPKDSKGSIIMCNHLSNADPFFLCAALFPWEGKFISKASLFNVPFGGWCMRLAGDIPVYFTKDKGGWGTAKGSVSKMMDHCKSILKQGANIIVFPEGARTRNGKIQEFKDGLFQLATELGTDIIPMAIAGSENGWTPGDWKFNSCTAYVTVGAPISSKTLTDYKQLKNKVKEQIITLYYTMPKPPVILDYASLTAPKEALLVLPNSTLNSNSNNNRNVEN